MPIIFEDQGSSMMHYGILRRSGRYPYGSGKDGAQKYPWEAGETPVDRANAFQGMLRDLRKQGVPDKVIAQGFGMNTNQLRDTVSIAREAKKQADISRATKLKYEKGMSNVAIGKAMGKGESYVRGLLREGEADRNRAIDSTAAMLRDSVGKDNYIDVGKGVERYLNISEKRLKTAVSVLQSEGYVLHKFSTPTLGTNNKTNIKVITPPGTTFAELMRNKDRITQARGRSKDGGETYPRILPPISIDSKRIKVRYAEEGGTDADGTIYIRPGVDDVSIGKASYAQVRVGVDGTHYLKGMAIYRDDLPEGVDLVFNTNKKNTGNKLDAMKPMKVDKITGEIDRSDPFGSQISDQIQEIGHDGKPRLTSAMNIVNQEGNWDDWSKTLSSQMLSKQKPILAEQQLDIAYESKKREFDDIMSIENPTLRKFLLEKFADSADASAVNLKAAHLPRQKTKVILPVNTMKENEVYAPTFNHGEVVVLVRFPHGHISEIPQLRVNNRHPDAKKLLGNAPDAIGIHSKVAEQLSGADFDGDTVLVIPNNLGKIQVKPQLEGLKDFDPKSAYPAYPGMEPMTPKIKGMQMGYVSNLITDMTIKGANDSEIERALRHSMVVIDAEKHNLDYKRSAIENGIPALMEKYQKRKTGGADTLISKAGSRVDVAHRKLRSAKDGGPIDPKTGRKVYVETGEEYSPGNPRYIKSKKLAETDDAHTLVSEKRARIEVVYANHSNRLKRLAEDARKELVKTPNLVRSPSAAKAYAEDVKDLDAALNKALQNAPLERQAQLIGGEVFKRKKEANPDADAAEIKKMKSKALLDARSRVGAEKARIELTPRQWEAIQSGAISNNKLKEILDNANVDQIKELAMPKDRPALDAASKSRAIALLRNDRYTLAEVANQLGVSVSTLTSSLSGEES